MPQASPPLRGSLASVKEMTRKHFAKELRSGGGRSSRADGIHVAWAVWTLALTLVFGRIAAFNLGNYRPVSNDEMELMAVAYKLATQGVLGSDLYAGFYNADQHFMITLPLEHVFNAASFKIFGAGVAQMRWVSVVAGA